MWYDARMFEDILTISEKSRVISLYSGVEEYYTTGQSGRNVVTLVLTSDDLIIVRGVGYGYDTAVRDLYSVLYRTMHEECGVLVTGK